MGRVIWLVSLLTILASTATASARREEADHFAIYVNEDWLALQVVAEQPMELIGVEISVTSDDLKTYRTELGQRFGTLVAMKHIAPPGMCFIFVYNDEAPLPTPCDNPDTNLEITVTGRDRFWYNAAGQRRQINVDKEREPVMSCPPSRAVCPVPPSAPSQIPPFSQPIRLNETPIRSTALAFFDNSDQGTIQQVSWSPNGSYIVTAHKSGDICLWHQSRRGEIGKGKVCYEGFGSTITAMDWEPNADRSRFLAVSDEGMAGIWDIVEEQSETVLDAVLEPHTLLNKRIEDADWHPKENRILTTDDTHLSLWELQDGTPTMIKHIPASAPLQTVWFRNGGYAALIDELNEIRVFDTTRQDENGVTIGNDHVDSKTRKVVALDWNPKQDDLLLIADDEGVVRLYTYDVGTVCPNSRCKSMMLAQNLNNVTDVKFSPNGTLAAVTNNEGVHVLEAQPPYRLVKQYGLEDNIGIEFTSVDWRPDGSEIVAADSAGKIYVWNLPDEFSPRLEQIYRWEATRGGQALDLTWRPDGAGIAIVDTDRNLSVWGVENQMQQGADVAHYDIPVAVDWNPTQNDQIATSGCGPLAAVWESSAVDVLRERPAGPQSSCFSSIAFHPDGELLLVSDENGDMRVWEWDPDNISSIDYAFAHMNKNEPVKINELGWNRPGTHFAAVDQKGVLKVFELRGRTTEEIFMRELDTPVQTMAWSPNDEMIATGDDNGTVTIWRLDSGLAGPGGGYELRGHEGPVRNVSWSRDWLVSVGDDMRVIVWNARTGERLAQGLLPATPTSVAWTANPGDMGDIFAITDEDGFITVWAFES